MAPPRRVVSKASPAIKKNQPVISQAIAPSKRKASQSQKPANKEEYVF
jgi:hypothetical protein